MKWFANCKNLDEAKTLHRNLAKEHHPDRGGKTEVMQEVNNEYDQVKKRFKNGTWGQNSQQKNQYNGANDAYNAWRNSENSRRKADEKWEREANEAYQKEKERQRQEWEEAQKREKARQEFRKKYNFYNAYKNKTGSQRNHNTKNYFENFQVGLF